MPGGAAFPIPAPREIQYKENRNEQTVDNYIELINKLKSLLPLECGDKLKALEEVIKYVGALLYGDDLHCFITYNDYKKYVNAALDELVCYVQEHSLEKYSEELTLLKEELNGFLKEKEQYLKELEELKKEKEELQSQVAKLKEENQLLTEENTKMKASVEDYSKKMKSLENNNQVSWEPVKENDPIYAITPNTINGYIHELERAYMCKLGVSEEECKSDFMLNSSGLYELRKLLFSFKDRNNLDKPISYIINNSEYIGIDISRGRAVKSVINNIKLPKILERTSTLSISNSPNDKEDLNGFLRELYYQRVAFEAVAKQRIAEAQVYSLGMELKRIAPEGYDFSEFPEIMEKPSLEDKGRSYIKNKERGIINDVKHE